MLDCEQFGCEQCICVLSGMTEGTMTVSIVMTGMALEGLVVVGHRSTAKMI